MLTWNLPHWLPILQIFLVLPILQTFLTGNTRIPVAFLQLCVRTPWLIARPHHLCAIVCLLRNKWSFFRVHYATWCHLLCYLEYHWHQSAQAHISITIRISLWKRLATEKELNRCATWVHWVGTSEVCVPTHAVLGMSLCRFCTVNCVFWAINILNWLFRHYFGQ